MRSGGGGFAAILSFGASRRTFPFGPSDPREPVKEMLIKSLFDFTLEFSCNARNNPTQIASYLRRVMTKRCMKIHVKSNSAI